MAASGAMLRSGSWRARSDIAGSASAYSSTKLSLIDDQIHHMDRRFEIARDAGSGTLVVQEYVQLS